MIPVPTTARIAQAIRFCKNCKKTLKNKKHYIPIPRVFYSNKTSYLCIDKICKRCRQKTTARVRA